MGGHQRDAGGQDFVQGLQLGRQWEVVGLRHMGIFWPGVRPVGV